MRLGHGGEEKVDIFSHLSRDYDEPMKFVDLAPETSISDPNTAVLKYFIKFEVLQAHQPQTNSFGNRF